MGQRKTSRAYNVSVSEILSFEHRQVLTGPYDQHFPAALNTGWGWIRRPIGQTDRVARIHAAQ